ncbi:MAG: BTAD domain-containing putative transcriptional regulator [Gordonia sp. (in: high G+C Gram-positive bacteria)]
MNVDSPALEIRVLGPLRAIVDGQDVPLGGPMPRALLSRLIVAGGETVPVERIVDDLWGDEAPRSVSSTLHGYISTLRRGLEPGHGSGSPEVLVRRGAGYALILPAGAVDADRFLALARRGGELLSAGAAADARDVLERALSLWSGEAYSDSRRWEFAIREADRLTTVRTAAAEDRLAALSELGENDVVAAEAAAAVQADPLRERSWELLALAHYRSGRQAEALESLRRATAVLAAELGADPGPSLRDLQARILRHDPALRQVDAAERPIRSRRHVPTPLTSFVGRDDDVSRVSALLDEHRMVTVTGPGGMGKTRVALEVATRDDADDGPWFVEFAGLAGGDTLIEQIMRVLGVKATGGTDQLSAVIGERRTLLVLDNCEHVLTSAAPLVETLLGRCPGLRILTTSRVRLGVPGEHVYSLAPLTDGVSLFYERAGSAAPEAQRAQVAALCEALDNLPLAIELAAARTVMLSVSQLIEMLDERFALLADESRAHTAAGGRHASMQAVIDGSYEALSASERTLFTELSVFDGGFDFEAVREVVGGHVGALLTGIGALVDKSLITVLGGDPRRYRMLEVLREYGAERLSAERAAELRLAHVQWIKSLAYRAHHQMRGFECVAWTRRIDDELANVHAALDYARVHDWPSYVSTVGSMYWFWYRRGLVEEGLRRFTPLAAEQPGISGLPVEDQVRAVVGQIMLAYLAGEVPAVLDGLQRLAALLESDAFDEDSREVRLAQADASVVLGFFQAGVGVVDEGRRWARLAASLAQENGYPMTYAETQMALGMAAYRSAEHEEAQRQLADAVQTAESCGYEWLIASALWIATKDDISAGRFGEAPKIKLAGMLAACERAFDLSSWMVGVATLSYICFREGAVQTAARLAGVVERRTELTGYAPGQMDIIDLAAYAEQTRTGATEAGLDWDEQVRFGKNLDVEQVRELVAAALGGSRGEPRV